MNSDEYKTIETTGRGMYKEKGSRFVSVAIPFSDPENIKVIIDSIRKEHHEARHHCYAYMIGAERKIWRANDDGEPSGTAGRPILGQISSAGLTNILIVVSRYFGGTLLGVSGLINAYREAAFSAIKDTKTIEKTIHDYYEITFPYIALNDVMKILKDENLGHSKLVFDLDCTLKVDFRVSAKDRILSRLDRIDNLKYRYIETR